MSAQYTPGPWVAVEWSCHAATTVRAGDVTVAECSGHGRMSSDCEADARLIAAAPDLLLALGMLTDTIAFQFAGEVEQRLARAAIAKARGAEQPTPAIPPEAASIGAVLDGESLEQGEPL